MAAILPAISVLSIATTAIGTGIAFFSQRQQAAQAASMARYNYELSQQQAAMQLALSQQQATTNAQMLQYQAAAQQRNADVLKLQAGAVLRNFGQAADTEQSSAAVNAQRERENSRRFLALQMAKVAGSGFALAGTPLDALADAAGTLELRSQEIYRGGQIAARKLNQEGEIQAYQLRNESDNSAIASSLSLFSASNERWKGEAALSEYRLNLAGNELQLQKGLNDASGYKMASYGTLFSGITSLGDNINRMNYYGGI